MNTTIDQATPEMNRACLALLADNADSLGQSRDFAASLLRQHTNKGRLSPRQWYWVRRLARQIGRPEPEQAQVAQDMSAVYAMFETAQRRLKWPKIWLSVRPGLEIRLSVAGPRARVPGSITVVTADNIWLGRIHQDGRFEMTRSEQGERLASEIVTALVDFASDPARVAAQHGHKTGHCCFCNRSLRDERSTDVGYGPVCAKTFGLEWGTPAKAA